jgi:hypothetical protein
MAEELAVIANKFRGVRFDAGESDANEALRILQNQKGKL